MVIGQDFDIKLTNLSHRRIILGLERIGYSELGKGESSLEPGLEPGRTVLASQVSLKP